VAGADRISRECVDIADGTDSMDAGTAWLARAEVLAIAGRRAEAAEAAERARDLYAKKGWVSAIRRAEALLDA
jgi:predicted Zn-dependent protease